MMKQANKCSSSAGKGDSTQLEELRKRKEQILKEMKEQEILKNMRKAQHAAKGKAVLSNERLPEVNHRQSMQTENVKIENTDKIRKFSKIPNKSFTEILQEANEKEALKRKMPTNSEVPAKKQKILKDQHCSNQMDPPLRSINAIKIPKKVDSDISNSKLRSDNRTISNIPDRNNSIKNINLSQKAGRHELVIDKEVHKHKKNETNIDHKQQIKKSIRRSDSDNKLSDINYSNSKGRLIFTQNDRSNNYIQRDRENDILTNNRNIQNSLSKNKTHVSEHSSRNIEVQNSRGIKAQSAKGILTQSGRGILAQSGRGILAQNGGENQPQNRNQIQSQDLQKNNLHKSKIQEQKKREIQAQKDREIRAQKDRDIHAKRERDKELHRNRDIQAKKNRDIQAQRDRDIQAQRDRDIQAQRNRDLQAQRARENQHNRGIAAQNNRGIAAQNNRGIAAQNNRGIAAQNNRGIAAQNGRGIAAQNGRGIAAQNTGAYMSDCSEDEYDSEMDDFIDDDEVVVDDNIKQEIYKSLRYDPKKYETVRRHDDCRGMESSIKDIRLEEIRSTKIAMKEDKLEELAEMERLKKKGKL